MNAPPSENKKAEDEARVEGGQGEPAPSVDASIQGLLGRKLRENYEEVVKEEVPKKFMDLLDQLKRTEKGNAKEGGS